MQSKAYSHMRAVVSMLTVPCLLVLLLGMFSPASGSAQVLLLDFGAAANTTQNGPSPEDPARFWNNISDAIGTSATGQLLNLVTTDNTPTEIDFMMVSRFNGANGNGTTTSTLYPIEATRDSLFGNTETFNGQANIFPVFKLTSLNPAAKYNFSFYASRTGVSDNRETLYTVVGATTSSAVLNAANNVNNTVEVNDVVPDNTGTITISLTASPNNNNANHFTYIGVMKLVVVPPQTPIGFTLEPVSRQVGEFSSVTFTAAVTGAPPYFIQWLSNGLAIPGANQLSYTIPSATLDMDGSLFSVNVSNLAYSATSSNAVLRVVNDTFPPTVVSVSSPDGNKVLVTFSEQVEPFTATDVHNYQVNFADLVTLAELQPDSKTVALTLSQTISGQFTVTLYNVQDLFGNPVEFGVTVTAQVPEIATQSLLLDFGGTGVANTTEHGSAPDDPINYWNNITTDVGALDNGQMSNLITSQNASTGIGLTMVRRFNGANLNGTVASAPFPTDATRDSLYGNTEVFGGLTDIYPKFKLTGLSQDLVYDLTFYASRTGVGDNRETGYTVEGAATNVAVLNAANNVTNTVTVAEMAPDASGEITISLAPTANNNNANHFTYLSVLVVQPKHPATRFLQPTVSDGLINLQWSGRGELQGAPSVLGPWSPVEPLGPNFHSEPIAEGNRFFRLQVQ